MQLIKNRELTLSSSNGSAVSTVDTIDRQGEPQVGAQVVAILEKIDVQFANRNDHHLGRLAVSLFSDFGPGERINVSATCALRDWSGGDAELNGDDPFEVKLAYSVLIV
jgi:hypothetical protein